jgi:hypothetical protein
MIGESSFQFNDLSLPANKFRFADTCLGPSSSKIPTWTSLETCSTSRRHHDAWRGRARFCGNLNIIFLGHTVDNKVVVPNLLLVSEDLIRKGKGKDLKKVCHSPCLCFGAPSF